MSEEDDFFAQMRDVTPLKPTNRREDLADKSRLSKAAAELRRRLAEGDDETIDPASADELKRDYVSDEYVDRLKPDDILSFKRGGVQDGVYRKFRLGKYPIEARLDLHRMTVEQAKREVESFLSEAIQREHRTVLILHGKGDRNPDPERQAVLKSYLAKWLKEITMVLAYHSAQQQHGGRGAVYVMLKKSEAMKEKTREKFR